MPNGLYHVDPQTGAVIFEDVTNTLSPSSLDAIFGSGVEWHNGSLVDVTNGGTLLNMGQQGPSTFNVLDSGAIHYVTPVTARSANAPLSGNQQRQVTADIRVIDYEGNDHTVSISSVSLNHLGKQVGYQIDEYGNEHETRFDAIYRNTAELQADLGPAYRLATPKETIERSLRYGLTAEYGGIIKDIADAGGVLGGTGEQTQSETLLAIAQMATLAMTQVYTTGLLKRG